MTTAEYRSIGSLALLGAALAFSACTTKDSATDSTSTMSSTTTSTATSANGAPGATATDSQTAGRATNGGAPADPSTFSDANIIAKEIAGDSAEVVLAGLAKTRATDAGVKAYAAQLVSDHSKGLTETLALAKKLSITPEVPAGDTTSIGTAHMQSRLQSLAKGPAFDSVFVNHEVQDHEDDIKDAKAMSTAAKNAQVKSLVDKSIPELQKHLDRAQKLAANGK